MQPGFIPSEMNVFGQHVHSGSGDHEISFACCCKLFTFVYFIYFIYIWEWESASVFYKSGCNWPVFGSFPPDAGVGPE